MTKGGGFAPEGIVRIIIIKKELGRMERERRRVQRKFTHDLTSSMSARTPRQKSNGDEA